MMPHLRRTSAILLATPCCWRSPTPGPSAAHHRAGPLPLRLGRRSADLARRIAGRLRPRHGGREEGRLCDADLDREERWRGEPPRALTAGTRDVSPRWSPDGRHLAFVRTSEVDGRPQRPQIHVMTMGEGEPRAITDMPRGAANPEWAPDNRTIAFTSGTTDDDMERHRREKLRGREAAGKDETDEKKDDPAERRARATSASSRAPCTAPTACPAGDTSIPIGPRTSGP
jgi:hypothetical protein